MLFYEYRMVVKWVRYAELLLMSICRNRQWCQLVTRRKYSKLYTLTKLSKY